jgi:hypothetical protein
MTWSFAYADNWTPTNLVVTDTTSSSTTLSWTPPVDTNGLTGYRLIEEGVLMIPLSTVTSFTKTNQSASSTYSYMLLACYANYGCEAQGPTVSATTKPTTPVVVVPKIPDVEVGLPAISTKAIVSTAVTGAITNQTIQITVKLPDTSGVPMAMYVAAILNSQVFFLNSSGGWVGMTGNDAPAFESFGVTSGPKEVSVPLVTSADLSGLVNTQIYIGYGRGLVGLTNPFQFMLNEGTYNLVYTIK